MSFLFCHGFRMQMCLIFFGQKLEISIIVNRKYPHKLLHATKYVVYHTKLLLLSTPNTYAWVEGLVNGEMRREMPLHEFF